MRCRFLALFLFAWLVWVGRAAAQVPWESPLLVGPGSPAGLSLLLVDPGPGMGVMAQWTGSARNVRLGYRVGLAEDHRDDLAVFGGLDISGPLVAHGPEFPLDMIWVTGVGLGVGKDGLITVPLGVSMGRVVPAEEVRIHPYLAPRLVLDAFTGGNREDDMELGFALDLGVDFAFSDTWVLRLGASVGDREGVAFGFAVPGVG